MSPVLACGTIQFSLPMVIGILAFVFGPAVLSTVGFIAWFRVKLRDQTPYSLRSLMVWMTIIGLNFGWLTRVFGI